MPADRDRDASKFVKRDWVKICSAWANYIPTFDHGIGWPEEEVDDLPQMRTIYDLLSESPEGESQELDGIEFLYRETFIASVAYARRATHVLRSTLGHSQGGFRSWSRVSAYHAAFFAMQAIIRVLGAVLPTDRSTDRTFQIDLWAVENKASKRLSLVASTFNAKGFFRSKSPLRHYHFWSIFTRLMRSTAIPSNIWPYAIADRFKQVDDKAFAEIRNRLDYRASYWPYDDLVAPLAPEDLQAACTFAALEDWTNGHEDGQFPLLLSLQLVPMALRLLHSTAEPDTPLAEELANRIQDLANVGVRDREVLALI